MTLCESAKGAVLPWFSLDALRENDDFERLPQQRIDVCLMCQMHSSACDKCDGRGNLKRDRGRPKKEIDTALLREMMALRRCNAEMCAALGVSKRKLAYTKTQSLKGELS